MMSHRARAAGGAAAFAVRLRGDGELEEIEPGPRVALPHGVWGVARSTRAFSSARLRAVWEDTPFYTRSVIEADLTGAGPSLAVHESLDLDRFNARWVQALLGVRMPRRARR